LLQAPLLLLVLLLLLLHCSMQVHGRMSHPAAECAAVRKQLWHPSTAIRIHALSCTPRVEPAAVLQCRCMLSLQDRSRQQPRLLLLLCCMVRSAAAGSSSSSSSGAGADRV
jgi:hypothetical protein